MDKRSLTGEEVLWPVTPDPSNPVAPMDVEHGIVQSDPEDGFMEVALPDGSETRINKLSVLPAYKAGEITESISLTDIKDAEKSQTAARSRFARKLSKFIMSQNNPSR